MSSSYLTTKPRTQLTHFMSMSWSISYAISTWELGRIPDSKRYGGIPFEGHSRCESPVAGPEVVMIQKQYSAKYPHPLHASRNNVGFELVCI